MAAMTLPDMVKNMAEGVIGAPILSIYGGMREAQESGQQLPAEAYAEFILAANEQLSNRGKTGAAFAQELGKQYAESNTKLAEVMKDISNGVMAKNIADIMEQNKTATPAQPSHVERLMNPQKAP